MRQLITILALLAVSSIAFGQCSSVCSGGSLVGYSGVSCACGITYDVALPGVVNPLGNDTRHYDAFWPTTPGVTNTLREGIYVHGGGWHQQINTSGYPITAANIDAYVMGNSGTRTSPVNLYVLPYTVVTLYYLTATLNSGASSMTISGNQSTGCSSSPPDFYPTGGTPFNVYLDSGTQEETVGVNSYSGSCNSGTWTFTSGGKPSNTHSLQNYTVASVAAATGSAGDVTTTYTGTFTNCGSNACAGLEWYITGCGSNGNGQYMASASTITTLTLDNIAGTVATCSGGNAEQLIPVWVTNFYNSAGYPVFLNDVADFMAFLAHCSAGGTSYNTGTCTSNTSGTGHGTDVPGNPLQMQFLGGSSGGLAESVIQGDCNTNAACTYLDNSSADAGRGQGTWDATAAWKVANQYGSGNSGGSGTAAIWQSMASDPGSNLGLANQNNRFLDNDGQAPIGVCGCFPNCDNANPASFSQSTLQCTTNASSCYTTCMQNLGVYYNSLAGTSVPVLTWTCDGVGSGGSCPTTGIAVLGAGDDPIYGQLNCLESTQKNMTVTAYPAGHGCNTAAFNFGITLQGDGTPSPAGSGIGQSGGTGW